MDGTISFGIVSLNVTLYLAVAYILSRFLYERFFKSNKKNNWLILLDTIPLFIFVLISAAVLPICIILVTSLTTLNINFIFSNNAIKFLQYNISIIIVTWIIGLAMIKDKKFSNKKIKHNFIGIFIFTTYLLTSLIIFIICFFLLQKHSLDVLGIQAIPAIFMIYLILLLAYYYFTRIILKIKNIKEFWISKYKLPKTKLWQFLLILAIILSLVISILLLSFMSVNIPTYKIVLVNSTSYEVTHLISSSSYASDFPNTFFEVVDITTNITSTGNKHIFPEQVQFITIDYSPYVFNESSVKIFIHDRLLNKTFEFDRSKNEFKDAFMYNYESHGFANVSFNYEKKFITIKYSKGDFKDIDNVMVEGLSPINISTTNFSYYSTTNYGDSCNTTNCIFIINITNNLDKPVLIDYESLNNLLNFPNILNKTLCHITKIEPEFNNAYTLILNHCKDNLCQIILNDKELEHYTIIYSLSENQVGMYPVTFEKPITLQSKLYIECN